MVDYSSAVKTIKEAILRSQYQAARLVNRELLSLYYGIGRYISTNTRVGFWGTGAVRTISERLRRELPGLKGFSETSIKKMRQFYEQWEPVFNKSTAATVDLTGGKILSENVIDIKGLVGYNSTAATVNFNIEEFLALSFSHHIEIINKIR